MCITPGLGDECRLILLAFRKSLSTRQGGFILNTPRCNRRRLKFGSLRSKHFCLSSEQRNTEEGDFRCWTREKWSESEKMEERGGGGKGKALPHPYPLFYSPHFSCGLWLSFLVLCSKTRLRIVGRRRKKSALAEKKKKKKKKNGERSGPRGSLGRGISFFSYP